MVAAAVLIVAAGCVTKDEVARVPSPSGRLDAIVLERNGGATVSFGYEVYVVPHGRRPWAGEQVANFYGASRSENAYGVTTRWAGPRDLVIEYLRARTAELLTREVTVSDQRVRVVIRDGVSDPAAPTGGMLYNLERPVRQAP